MYVILNSTVEFLMSAVYMGGVPVTGIDSLKVGAARITGVDNMTLGATDRITTEFSETPINFMPYYTSRVSKRTRLLLTTNCVQ